MQINVRQICFILFFYSTASKLLQYPTYLSEYAGRDLLFSAAISFLLQGVIIWATAYLCSRTDKTFYELLKDTFGSVAARVVFALFAAYFALVAVMPLIEQMQYVHAIFYDTVPSLPVFLPVLFFTLYAGSKPLKNIGRCADVCTPIFLVSLFFVTFMSFSGAKFSRLLPLFQAPQRVFGGVYKTAYYFTEPSYLLMFMGRFKYEKHDAAKITASYALSALTVLLFLALFYSIYGEITPSRQYAISKTALYFSAIDTVGRVDLLALYALEIVMLFALVLNIQLCVHCLECAFRLKNTELLSVLVNLALAAVLIFTKTRHFAVHYVFANWIWIAVLIFSVIMPLASWALRRDKDGA